MWGLAHQRESCAHYYSLPFFVSTVAVSFWRMLWLYHSSFDKAVELHCSVCIYHCCFCWGRIRTTVCIILLWNCESSPSMVGGCLAAVINGNKSNVKQWKAEEEYMNLNGVIILSLCTSLTRRLSPQRKSRVKVELVSPTICKSLGLFASCTLKTMKLKA